MARYQWKPGFRASGDAQTVGNTLEALRREGSGTLTPGAVVLAARNRDSPLHGYFEWDRTQAARLHNEEEARRLIRSIYVIQEENEGGEPGIAFICVTTEQGRGYVSAARVISQDDLRRQALAEALALLRGVQKRFSHLTELSEVWEAIGRIGSNGEARPQRAGRRAQTRV